MYVLVTYLNENDQMKRRSRAANSIKGDGIWQKFIFIQAFVGVLITSKNEKIHQIMKALELSQHFFHCKSRGIFPDAQGQLTPQPDV